MKKYLVDKVKDLEKRVSKMEKGKYLIQKENCDFRNETFPEHWWGKWNGTNDYVYGDGSKLDYQVEWEKHYRMYRKCERCGFGEQKYI